MAEIWKGAPVAKKLTEELIKRRERLDEKEVVPTLAILRVGSRGDDIAYETAAMNRCKKVGIAVRRFLLPESCTRETLLETVREINADDTIHGCLMFRPLPDREAQAEACELLAPEKDVDGMTPQALGSIFINRKLGYPPCTAQACLEVLDYYGVDLEGKRVTVIGRSLVIGRPLAMMLQARNATVTMCHTRTADVPKTGRNAEILIASAGRAWMVNETFTSPGQILLDVGINVGRDGVLRGDVNTERVEPVVKAITPVPGGIGAVTTAVLAKHVIMAAEKAAGID